MNKTAVNVAVLYMALAVFSTAINIGTQILSIWIYDGKHAVEVSILAGTVTGLPLRYVLEKRYIFSFRSRNIRHDGRLFALYVLMGVFTTVIFWGIEYAFHLMFGTDKMRYVGGVLGLIVGFYLKYRLDKKYVFVASDTTRVLP